MAVCQAEKCIIIRIYRGVDETGIAVGYHLIGQELIAVDDCHILDQKIIAGFGVRGEVRARVVFEGNSVERTAGVPIAFVLDRRGS